jgi:hypothetical protein
MEGEIKVVDGKGRIEIQIDTVSEDQMIQIEYHKPVRLQVLVSIATFVGFFVFLYFCGEIP